MSEKSEKKYSTEPLFSFESKEPEEDITEEEVRKIETLQNVESSSEDNLRDEEEEKDTKEIENVEDVEKPEEYPDQIPEEPFSIPAPLMPKATAVAFSNTPLINEAPELPQEYEEEVDEESGEHFLSVSLIEEYKLQIKREIAKCVTNRDILAFQARLLSLSVGLAAKIYENVPTPETSQQLASLTSAHNQTIALIEKMKDPKKHLKDLEDEIRKMFTMTLRAMAQEIDKTRNEMIRAFPNDQRTVHENFSRMLDAIQPETTKIYEDFHEKLKNILGIKGSKK